MYSHKNVVFAHMKFMWVFSFLKGYIGVLSKINVYYGDIKNQKKSVKPSSVLCCVLPYVAHLLLLMSHPGRVMRPRGYTV